MQFFGGGALGSSSSPSSGVVLDTVTVFGGCGYDYVGAGYGEGGVDAGYAICVPVLCYGY